MSSDQITVAVPGAAKVTTPLRNLFQPIVLLLDLQGIAIEDANNAGEYWTITPEENEAHP